ncbi:MAG: cupin, partial [Gallionella sp.]
MAIHHASSGELIDIRPLKGSLKTAVTKTLYKSNHLEVFRKILLAGEAMSRHQVAGEITVQCLEGSVDFSMGE